MRFVDPTGMWAEDWISSFANFSATIVHAAQKAVGYVNPEFEFLKLDADSGVIPSFTVINAQIKVDQRDKWDVPDGSSTWTKG